MRDSPVFDSTHPETVPLTAAERAEIEERMQVLADAREHEDDIPDMQDRL